MTGRIRASLIAAGLGVAALASSPAWADLELQVSDDGGAYQSCGSCTDSTNKSVSWNGGNFADFVITALGANGVGLFGSTGELLDLAELETASMSAGTLSIQLTETNLTAGTVATFLSSFTGTLTSISATRSFYFNVDNAAFGKETLIGSTSVGGIITFLNTEGLSGKFSLTEEVDITATAQGGSLSTDDNVTLVPEPVTLSLFGSGLLALGAMSRRRRKPVTPA